MVERPLSFDVVMESLFDVDRRIGAATDKLETIGTVAIAKSLTDEDTTPSDSGVQMLDSESSELMVESITSQTGFDFEDLKPLTQNFQIDDENDSKISSNSLPSPSDVADVVVSQPPAEGEFDTNSNVMTTSNCSTFDTENIVYRRKFRKSPSKMKTPKKRVSFHEDILKNTRTDNIHIEHGFVTYKNGRKTAFTSAVGRYSWCSEGDDSGLCSKNQDDDQESQVVYRNACSDVLDYGNLDVYDNPDRNYAKYDNSGVFEYTNQKGGKEISSGNLINKINLNKCSCSSSNSSLDSEVIDKNCNSRQNYGQAKSSSCDCIGTNNINNNFIGESCYFSEPNINNLNDKPKKSVWSKEKKPISSCLKKNKWHTQIIPEQERNNKMKKFNVHDMNHLIDNSKMIFGSLKSIFATPLPERGVPEGSEDVQSVYECLPEVDNINQQQEQKSPSPMKQRPFLSKSLDGSKRKNSKINFIHNVDEQLRRKNEADLFAPTRQNSSDNEEKCPVPSEQSPPEPEATTGMLASSDSNQFRNKFIINCESTVFEHTGVSYNYETLLNNQSTNVDTNVEEDNVKHIAQPAELDRVKEAFMSVPIKQTFANFFRTLKETATSPNDTVSNKMINSQMTENSGNAGKAGNVKIRKPNIKEIVRTNESSSNIVHVQHSTSPLRPSFDGIRTRFDVKHNRHLESPIKGRQTTTITSRYDCLRNRMSPDLFNFYNGGSGRESKSTILSEEFDEILTITTDTDKNENDIVIVDYPELSDNGENEYASSMNAMQMQQHLLKPQTKTSLINRFLRNVTQKKIIETNIRKNDFFANKMKSEQKLFAGNLYMRGVKPKNIELIEDLNAEIAMEIEMSTGNSPRRELVDPESGLPGDISRFELGIGEISIDIFNGNYMHILRSEKEHLMKVFKLYTGYSREGFMTPVLVFLTDQTLYVVDLVRSCLCSKFVLAYSDLDVILMGPYGNTVLLSNSSRDMQQVLLAGGPYPADRLVANLELCARRGGSVLPAVGQLTLGHLEPLQGFVREHSTLSKNDTWVYYAVVNIPAGTLGCEKEPLGPHVKGFLMHRRIKEHAVNSKQSWDPGYFLLKAGVLYMFNDSSQKLPSWAMALAECKGARRALKTGRPHCFEILVRNQLLQLAAPDEYVASEWLQALLQSASGLFEMQDKHKTLGCTMVMTENHLITLREDFTAPLRQLNKSPTNTSLNKDYRVSPTKDISDNHAAESSSIISSATSTPTRKGHRSNSSLNSTPTKFSLLSRSTANTTVNSFQNFLEKENSYTNMSSVYGKHSGVEILTCAVIKDMIAIKIPSHNETWWCVLEFSCQEVRESSDDLVLFFASSSEMQRFLHKLEQLWQAKNNDLFPITLLDENDSISIHCTTLYMDINRSWEPLLSAALGHPL